jgi:hypothetical protein
MNVTPVVGLSNEFLVLGFSPEAVLASLTRPEAAQPRLNKSESYEKAIKLVGDPTSAFAYLDTRTLFERVYGIFRPFLAMTMAFSPEAGQYFDAGKLPTTDVIVRHLGPSTFSQRQVENGILIESAGTLTVNQAVLGTAAGIGAAALPALQQAMAGGGGFMPPGFTSPSARPPIVPPGVPLPPAPLPPVPAVPPPAPDPAPAPAPPAAGEPVEA